MRVRPFRRRSTRPQVVIVGAGFGGLAAARRLRDASVDLIVVDRHNFHTFQPLLYQVATAGLDAENIAHAVRGIIRRRRFRSRPLGPGFGFRLGTVASVDWATNELVLDDG